MAFEWTDALAVGIPEIDAQHQDIFRQANAMLDAMKQGQGTKEVIRLLDFLEHYMVGHFGAEERSMSGVAYPGLADQVEQHRGFSEDFAAIRLEMIADGVTPVTVLVAQRKVSNWLRAHILKSDQMYGRFLAAKRCADAA